MSDTDIGIDLSLEDRTLTVGEETIELSNYDIKHLREVAGEEFGEKEAERAVGTVIEEQIEPFVESTGREVNRENIEKEVREAFSTHLYSIADPD